MTELELKEEFKKYLKDSSDYYDPREPITDRKLLQMWLDCAEPREKKITKLECQVNKLKEENEQLKAQLDKLLDFIVDRVEEGDVCELTDTCINSEGVCPFARSNRNIKDLIKKHITNK